MTRGSSTTLCFDLPFEASLISVLYITFNQNGKTVFEKTNTNCTLQNKSILLNLTQNDTLLFQEGRSIEVQIRLKTIDGKVMASDIVNMVADRILKDGEI